MSETKLTFIDSLEDLVALSEKLCSLSEFAVDLEVPTSYVLFELNKKKTWMYFKWNVVFSFAAPLLQELSRPHLSDADLHPRGGLYYWYSGAPWWNVHPERVVHWPIHCKSKETFPLLCLFGGSLKQEDGITSWVQLLLEQLHHLFGLSFLFSRFNHNLEVVVSDPCNPYKEQTNHINVWLDEQMSQLL